jgi:hypothetical protein
MGGQESGVGNGHCDWETREWEVITGKDMMMTELMALMPKLFHCKNIKIYINKYKPIPTNKPD